MLAFAIPKRQNVVYGSTLYDRCGSCSSLRRASDDRFAAFSSVDRHWDGNKPGPSIHIVKAVSYERQWLLITSKSCLGLLDNNILVVVVGSRVFGFGRPLPSHRQPVRVY